MKRETAQCEAGRPVCLVGTVAGFDPLTGAMEHYNAVCVLLDAQLLAAKLNDRPLLVGEAKAIALLVKAKLLALKCEELEGKLP